MAKEEQPPTFTEAAVGLLQEHSRTVLMNVGFFALGVLLIKSPIMDNMAPQL